MNRLVALTCLLAAFTGPARAASFDDPKWPCIQARVDTLSPGLMWPAAFVPLPEDPDLSDAVEDLAATLALRRVGEEEMRARVDAFAAERRPDLDLMGAVFDRVFTRLATRRGQIMDGIADYSESQIALAARIDDARTEFDGLAKAEDPDFDRLDVLEEQIDWDERIYTDRQQSLTYVCETPVLLERRLYAIAQMLQQAAVDS